MTRLPMDRATVAATPSMDHRRNRFTFAMTLAAVALLGLIALDLPAAHAAELFAAKVNFATSL